MSTHRYWRCINIVRAGGDSAYVSCGELQFRTEIGGPQSAVGGAAIGSSFWNLSPFNVDTLTPAKAFNGANTTTYDIWNQSNAVSNAYGYRDQWIGYNFVSPVEIVEVAVALRGDGYEAGQAWRSCNIETSDDGNSWRFYGVASGFDAAAGDYSLKAAVVSRVGAVSADIQVSRAIQNPLALIPGQHPKSSYPIARGWKNIYQGGAGTIQGTVTIENIPGARQVRLFDKRSGLLVAETWSAPTGQYQFSHIDASREYFVVAHDHLRVYNAVVQDMLTP